MPKPSEPIVDLDPPASRLEQLVDATAGRAAAIALGAGSLLRRQRVFHPEGIAFTATLDVDPQRRFGARLLDEPGRRTGTVRLSCGIGLPEGVPDILGVGLRVDPLGDGAEAQDLLFASVAGAAGPGRHLLARARSFSHRPLSTILPYRTEAGDDLVVLTLVATPAAAEAPAGGAGAGGSGEPGADGTPPTSVPAPAEATSARPAAGEAQPGGPPARLAAEADRFETGRLTFELRASTPTGEPVTVGVLRAERRLDPGQAEALALNPFHAAADLQPAGMVNALRRRAYAASQRARGWAAQATRS